MEAAGSFYSSSIALSFGEIIAITPTDNKHMTPPNIAAGIVPINFAVTPDSNSPISFDEPIKIEFTAEILPLI